MALTCPACGDTMRTVDFKSKHVDLCDGCKGVWFDLYELAETAFCALPPVTSRARTNRACPVCGPNMDIADMGGVHVERCRTCKGTFLDTGEFPRLRKGRLPQARKPGMAYKDGWPPEREDSLEEGLLLLHMLLALGG